MVHCSQSKDNWNYLWWKKSEEWWLWWSWLTGVRGRFLETFCASSGWSLHGWVVSTVKPWSCELTILFFLLYFNYLKKGILESVHSSTIHSSPNLKQLNGLMHSHTVSAFTHWSRLHTVHTLATTWMDLTDVIPSKLQPGAKEHTGWFHLWWHKFQN